MSIIPIILILLVVIPVLIFVFGINLSQIAFVKLGIPENWVIGLFLAILLGGMINIPIFRRKLPEKETAIEVFRHLFYYYPPKDRYQVIALNLGGAIIPILICAWLFPKTELTVSLVGIALMALISKFLARAVPGVGITMPAFLPPIIAALYALIAAPGHSAPVAYISGVLGVLIGADLLNLGAFKREEVQSISIGGAGIFDGIFLVGIVAALLS